MAVVEGVQQHPDEESVIARLRAERQDVGDRRDRLLLAGSAAEARDLQGRLESIEKEIAGVIGFQWHQRGSSWVGTVRNSKPAQNVMPQVLIDALSAEGFIIYGISSRETSRVIARFRSLDLAKDVAWTWVETELFPPVRQSHADLLAAKQAALALPDSGIPF